eukprot:NODE_1097_length_2219_cov_0.195755.p1 type:complete len:371 gc:universal NODE_1097_length_2219_cov_0.195755:275-1387(+)
MKCLITSLPVSESSIKSFRSLKKALKSNIVDPTSKEYVDLYLEFKNPNNNAKCISYIIEKSNKTTHSTHSNELVLFLVNPVSGKRQGTKIMKKMKKYVKLLKINHEIIYTKHSKHIQEINFSKYSKIIFISGDGLIFDYIQLAVTKNHLNIPIAIVKGGTGNALATSVDCLDPFIALLTALYGNPFKMTLTHYQFKSASYYSFLGLFWGLIADIDLKSERFRFAGALRTELGAVYFMLKRTQYHGKLTYLNLNNNQQETTEVDATCFLAMTLPFLDEEHFGCPVAKLQDPFIHIVYKNMKLKDGLVLLLNGRDLKQFNQIGMTYLKTTEFALEPLNDGVFDLDGEHVPWEPFHAKMTDLTVPVMCPPWFE